MKTPRAPAMGVHRIASPWVRNVLTGEVRREDGTGKAIASVPRGAPDSRKAQLDAQLRAAGYVLVDLPGGTVFEKDPEATQ